jgi:4-alpha-glucanotransferase
MNLPGTVSGNWRWRYKANSLTKEMRQQLLDLTLLYDR